MEVGFVPMQVPLAFCLVVGGTVVKARKPDEPELDQWMNGGRC